MNTLLSFVMGALAALAVVWVVGFVNVPASKPAVIETEELCVPSAFRELHRDVRVCAVHV